MKQAEPFTALYDRNENRMIDATVVQHWVTTNEDQHRILYSSLSDDMKATMADNPHLWIVHITETGDHLAIVIHSDGTIMVPTDWQQSHTGTLPDDLSEIQWCRMIDHAPAVVINGLPRIFE